MTAITKNRILRKLGLWYLAYEAVSLVAFLAFGLHFLPVH